MKIPKLPWWGWTLGAVLVAGGVMLYTKKKKTTAAAGSGAAPAAAPAPAAAATTSSTDPYAQMALEQQAQQQGQQSTANIVSAIQGLQGGNANPTTPQAPGYSQAPYTGEAAMGQGYMPASGNYGFIDTTGAAWEWITNTAALGTLMADPANYANLAWQPTPGVAQTMAATNGWPTGFANGTPVYLRVPQAQASIGQQTPSLATTL